MQTAKTQGFLLSKHTHTQGFPVCSVRVGVTETFGDTGRHLAGALAANVFGVGLATSWDILPWRIKPS